jgi:5'-nucleotidase
VAQRGAPGIAGARPHRLARTTYSHGVRPLVLLTNDDGILSPHLTALADALATDLDVLVVAPERQRSAASHAITLHKPLRLTRVAERRYALSGTPVDCVYVGILRVAGRLPDLVVSGVNDGFNLGSDVFYSGTVAGAIEGGLRGSVGLALSMAPAAPRPAAGIALCATIARATLAARLPARTVLNVNTPGTDDVRVRWTRLGRRHYEDDVSERLDPRGRPYYWIGGGASGHEDLPGSDCNAVADGVTAITPLRLDLAAHDAIDRPPFEIPGAMVG